MSDDTLLEDYIAQRDLLVKKRDELLKKQNTNTSVESKQTFKRRKVETIARTIDTYEYSKSLLSKHSRLPEMDMDVRLQYAHLTCPWMSILNINKSRSSRKDKSFTYETTLKFETCGEFSINLDINRETETVQKLTITPISAIKIIDENSTIKYLMEESMKSFDVSQFVYGMNTLLRMRHKRKRAWMSIIDDVDLTKLITINAFPVSQIKEKEPLNNLLFEHSPATVEFELDTNKKLRIDWYINFDSKQCHCISNFTAMVINDKDPENSENITKLLKSLIKVNNIKSAVLQILNIL